MLQNQSSMKRIILFFCFSFIVIQQISAQEIKYTNHTLAQGETLSALAKKYNTTVGDIMRLNGMHADSKLIVGQKIKIPEAGKPVPKNTAEEVVKTTPLPPAQETTAKKITETNIHVVKKGETLYSISKHYGVSVDDIKQWNNLQDAGIEIGQQLAVSKDGIEAAKTAKEQQQKEAASVTTVAAAQTAVEVKPDTKTTLPPAAENTAKTVTVPVNAEAPKPDNASKQFSVAADGSDNFFAKDFTQSKNSKDLKTIAGASGVFKTASGWDDKKFYILMNDAATGSVVKIKSPSGNIIYAKVLWPIDDIKANEGLQFRINDAAAAALGVTDQKFGLTVQYH